MRSVRAKLVPVTPSHLQAHPRATDEDFTWELDSRDLCLSLSPSFSSFPLPLAEVALACHPTTHTRGAERRPKMEREGERLLEDGRSA